MNLPKFSQDDGLFFTKKIPNSKAKSQGPKVGMNVGNFLVNGIIPKKIPNLVKSSIPISVYLGNLNLPKFSQDDRLFFIKNIPNSKTKSQGPKVGMNVGNFLVNSIIPKKIPNLVESSIPKLVFLGNLDLPKFSQDGVFFTNKYPRSLNWVHFFIGI